MKKLMFVIVFITSYLQIFSQVAVNTTGDAPHTSAMLDVSSPSKGFLPPSVANISDITSPDTGLLVFHSGSGLYRFYNGETWNSFLVDGNYWKLNGNSGTGSGNFVGTTDNIPLTFVIDNSASGRIDNTSKNTFWGYQSGNGTSVSGMGNSAIGYQSLNSLTTGNYNSVAGVYAMKSNTEASFNTAVGLSALQQTDEGDYNVAVGNSALSRNLRASYNVSIGMSSMFYLSQNYSFPKYNSDNVAIGDKALEYISPSADTNAIRNVAIGYNSSYSLRRGIGVTSFGALSASSNYDGNYNTAFGNCALYSNRDGSYNVAIGDSALYSTNGGSYNTAVGESAGNYGTANVTGNYNTFFGYHASTNNADWDNCIAIAGEGNISFYGGNSIRIGNSNMTSIGGEVSWTTVSDKRIKENVSQLDEKALDFVLLLKPVTYTFDLKKENRMMGLVLSEKGKKSAEQNSRIVHTGFLAQQVEEVAHVTGFYFDGIDKPKDENGLTGLRYAQFTVPLIKAVQIQQNIIENQNKTIKKLEKEIELLEQMAKELEEW